MKHSVIILMFLCACTDPSGSDYIISELTVHNKSDVSLYFNFKGIDSCSPDETIKEIPAGETQTFRAEESCSWEAYSNAGAHNGIEKYLSFSSKGFDLKKVTANEITCSNAGCEGLEMAVPIIVRFDTQFTNNSGSTLLASLQHDYSHCDMAKMTNLELPAGNSQNFAETITCFDTSYTAICDSDLSNCEDIEKSYDDNGELLSKFTWRISPFSFLHSQEKLTSSDLVAALDADTETIVCDSNRCNGTDFMLSEKVYEVVFSVTGEEDGLSRDFEYVNPDIETCFFADNFYLSAGYSSEKIESKLTIHCYQADAASHEFPVFELAVRKVHGGDEVLQSFTIDKEVVEIFCLRDGPCSL